MVKLGIFFIEYTFSTFSLELVAENSLFVYSPIGHILRSGKSLKIDKSMHPQNAFLMALDNHQVPKFPNHPLSALCFLIYLNSLF